MQQADTQSLRAVRDLEFRHLLEKLPAAAYTCDTQGLITYFNERAVELWGRAPKLNDETDRFCGSFRLFAPDGTEIAHDQCWMALALQNDREYNGQEIVIERDDLTRRYVCAYATPFHDESRRLTGAVNVLVDISDRKEFEERLLEETRITETLHRIGKLLAGELDLERLVQAVTDEATEITEAEFGAFFHKVTNQQGESFLLYTLSGVPKESFASFPMPRNTELFDPTFRGHAPIRLADVTQDPRYGRNHPYAGMPAGHLPVKSYLAVPVMSRSGENLGGLFFGHSQPGVFTQRHESLAVGIATQAAIAIDNANLYRQARHHAQQLQEADRRKDEFLAMLAHELRNPLVPIRSGLDILAMDPGAHQDTVGLMQEQVEHIVRLVDDLLDVSRIMRNRVELKREPVELAALVRRSAESFRSVVQDRQQQLNVSVPDQQVWVYADPVRLSQVFGNLLNNASKYMDDGGQIDLCLWQDGSRAVIKVCDTGIGIEPNLLPNVFELFTQSSRSLDRAQGGLGIGLTLVHRLVQLHDGTVTASSDGPGQGSVFEVRLPTCDRPANLAQPTPPPRNDRGRRIVVVDDNRHGAWLLSKLLGKLGDHTILTAHDGPSALELIRAQHPDIVLLDIGLPGIDGFEVGRQLRSDPQFDDVLLIALTGYGQEEHRRESQAAGFDQHLVKPPSIDQVRSVLSHPRLKSSD